jgi:uncharacterized integral membrane protein
MASADDRARARSARPPTADWPAERPETDWPVDRPLTERDRERARERAERERKRAERAGRQRAAHPESEVAAPPAAERATRPEPEPAMPADRERATRAERQRPRKTRAGSVWVAISAFAVVLVLLIIFIAQNAHNVKISFLAWSGQFPLSIALLIAAVGAAIITLMAGSTRIIQLRRQIRQQSKAPPVAGS